MIGDLKRAPWPWVRRRVLRKARKLDGSTGLLVAGRFPLTRLTKWPYLVGGGVVGVCDERFGLDNVRCGPFWAPLRPGKDYEVTVLLAGPLDRVRVTLEEGELRLLHIEPPKRDGAPAVIEFCRL